jgi:hypothetical protein
MITESSSANHTAAITAAAPKKSPEKMRFSKCCGVLRAFAGMTEIANEPKPRSKLLRACELLESFIARHSVRRRYKTAQ